MTTLYLLKNGKIEGPFSTEDLKILLLNKNLDPLTLACDSESQDDWHPVGAMLAGKKMMMAAPAQPISANPSPRGPLLLLCLLLLVALVISLCRSQFATPSSSAGNHEKNAFLSQLEAAKNEKSAVEEELQTAHREAQQERNFSQKLRVELDKMSAENNEMGVKLDSMVEFNTSVSKKHENLANLMYAANADPKNVMISSHLTTGVLKLSQDEVLKRVGQKFTAAGYTAVTDEDAVAYLVDINFNQMPTVDNITQLYTIEMVCYGYCYRLGNLRRVVVDKVSTMGYAGSRSEYRKSIYDFLVDGADEMINRLKMNRDQLAKKDLSSLSIDEDFSKAKAVIKSLEADKSSASASSSGSGCLLSSKGLILTNNHVVNKRKVVQVWLTDRRTPVEADVLAVDAATDLAIIRLRETADLAKGIKMPKISRKEPTVGQPVFTVGFPVPDIMGRQPKYSEGVVNSLTGSSDDPIYIQHSVPIQPGNSGGGLFSASGEIFGVVNSTLNSLSLLKNSGSIPQNVNYAVKSRRVWDFVEDSGLADELNQEARSELSKQDAMNLSVLIVVSE